MAQIDTISHLSLLRIALGEHLIIHLTIEIAILHQLMLCHLGAKLRIDISHQLRLGAESLGYPFGQAILRLGEGIPYPQTHREGSAIVTATHKGTRRSRSQGILHLLLHRIYIRGRLKIGIFDGLQTREQLLIILEGTRRRATRQELT